MKKLTKSQISNLMFLVLLVLIAFTPVGTFVKVYVNRLIATTPNVEDVADRKKLTPTDYNWTLKPIGQCPVVLQQYKGKVVIVNFWATWCPPCIAEMPSMQALYTEYKDKVTFLFVSQEKEEVIKSFIGEHGYTFPVFQYVSALPETFSHDAIPTTYVIDKEGAIVVDETGAANWNSKDFKILLDKLLSK